MKLYLHFAAMIAFVIVFWGAVIPFLTSAHSTAAVILGFVLVVLHMPLMYYWMKLALKKKEVKK